MKAEDVAKNFVDTQVKISRLEVGLCFVHNKVEEKARANYREALIKRNTLRLLWLTKNLSDVEYGAQCATVDAEISELASIIWPK